MHVESQPLPSIWHLSCDSLCSSSSISPTGNVQHNFQLMRAPEIPESPMDHFCHHFVFPPFLEFPHGGLGLILALSARFTFSCLDSWFAWITADCLLVNIHARHQSSVCLLLLDERCWNRLAGSHCSSEIMTILGSAPSSNFAVNRDLKWHAKPCIAKGTTAPISVSHISSLRKGSKGLSHNEMPNRRHWFGLTSEFGSFEPNHNPW